MQRDERGLSVTSASPEAVALFDRTLTENLEYRKSTMETLKAALAADPEFFMGHCLKGTFFLLFGDATFLGRVDQAIETCEALSASVTARECQHLAVLRAFRGGDQRRMAAVLSEILAAHPTDLQALRIQHFNNFYMGDAAALRDDISRALPAYEGHPGYSFVLGMLAFGLEESGDYEAAEAAGRRAWELNKDDLWAIHAVAHVLEMQGRHKEGLDWLDYPLDAWPDRNAFKGHLWWHRALYAIESGDLDHALLLYDQAVRLDKDSVFYLDLVNAASLLWRLVFLGKDVGDRWDELAEACAGRIGDHSLIFSSLHFLMALAGAGRMDDAARQVESLKAFAATPDNFGAETLPGIGLPLAEGISGLGTGDFNQSLESFSRCNGSNNDLGGSHAQRDIFTLFEIEALERGGQLQEATTRLRERAEARPTSWAAKAKLEQICRSSE